MKSRISLPFLAAGRFLAATGLLIGLFLGPAAQADSGERLPIIFVHGQSGSAQQFETQAMRFTSNGYPQGLLFAFEYDTSVAENPRAELDAYIDGVLHTTGADAV